MATRSLKLLANRCCRIVWKDVIGAKMRGEKRMNVDFGLTDRVAILTRASGGIGEAVAKTFADYCAKVVLASRKNEAPDGMAKSINEAGGESLPSESAS